jgi:hypothetical protein
MWGIVGLAKKYSARILEQACTVALAGNVDHPEQLFKPPPATLPATLHILSISGIV